MYMLDYTPRMYGKSRHGIEVQRIVLVLVNFPVLVLDNSSLVQIVPVLPRESR